MNTDNFKWTKELVLEFANEYRLSGRQITVDQFIEKKQKKPLFTTEDGVGVYEGDYYCYIMSDYRIVEYTSVAGRGGGEIVKGAFSTKEKAEEYIKWNKPQYSLTEVSNAIYKSGGNGLVILDNLSKQKSL